MRSKLFKSLILFMAIGLYSTAFADVLLIEQVRESEARDLPRNGMTLDEVLQRYGEPERRVAPVGDPPITRWVYPDFTVYFEYDLVINSVLAPGAVLGHNSGTQDD
ncbi:MAG: hypothetical protein Kow0020_11910 [Wenzhouxiangellaceae bacterium]